jgi:hypothetical protein
MIDLMTRFNARSMVEERTMEKNNEPPITEVKSKLMGGQGC